MNSKRLKFHQMLVDILGSSHVYFQPPATITMKYPCIVYSRSATDTKYANDISYNNRVCYSVVSIDPNPDNAILNKLLALPLSHFDRHYTADNLNHDVFKIYY